MAVGENPKVYGGFMQTINNHPKIQNTKEIQKKSLVAVGGNTKVYGGFMQTPPTRDHARGNDSNL